MNAMSKIPKNNCTGVIVLWALEWVVLPSSICVSVCQFLETYSYFRISSEDSKETCALVLLHTMLIPSTLVLLALVLVVQMAHKQQKP